MAIGFQRVPENDMSDLVKPGLVGMLGQRTDRNATSYCIALHIAVHEIEVLQRDIQCSQSSFGAVKLGSAMLPVMLRELVTMASSSTHSARARVSLHNIAGRNRR